MLTFISLEKFFLKKIKLKKRTKNKQTNEITHRTPQIRFLKKYAYRLSS